MSRRIHAGLSLCAALFMAGALPAQGKEAADQVAANKKVAHHLFDTAWNTGNFAVLDSLIPPEALDHASIPGKEPEKGSESFKKIIGTFRRAMPDLKMSILDEVAENDRVVHRWMIQGTHTDTLNLGAPIPPTHKQLTLTGTTIVRIAGGKVTDRWATVDIFGLMMQLGMIPGGPPAK